MALCDHCHQPLASSVHPYTLKLELFPAVEPSLQITPKDLQIDLMGEIERLVKIMAEMGDKEVLKQEKLVYVSHRFTLCPACRDRLARQLEALAPPPHLS